MSSSAMAGGMLDMNHVDFDFNLPFEQLFLSIVPSALFILSISWRIVRQFRKPNVINARAFQLIKLMAITTYVGLELTLLVLLAARSYPATTTSLPSAVLRLASALFMVALSLLDHSKSFRPSILLSSYLFSTSLFDAVQARTLFLASETKSQYAYTGVFTATLGYKVLLLLLEARQKSEWTTSRAAERSPEETCGIFSLGVYLWLNKIFVEGYSRVLTITDLFPLDSALRSQTLHERFSEHLDHSKLEGDKFGLLKALVRTLVVPLLLPIPARLALLGFTFSQPFFVQSLITHLSKPQPDPNAGYGLIGASMLIYAGIAVSMSLCWYFHHRMRAMVRSILVVEIYRKATTARIDTGRDSAALTLMSIDMDRINLGLRTIHDMWASLIQVALSCWMLYMQLGAVFVAPIALVIVCVTALGVLIKFTGDSQRAWMSKVQERVGLTATVIASMKSLKISALSETVSDFLHQLRVDELAAGTRYRTITILAALFGFVPMLIGPPLTFAFSRQQMDATKIFTSLSYLLLLTNPLTLIFQSIPELLSGLACLGRVQSFLEYADRVRFLADSDTAQNEREKLPIQQPTLVGHAQCLPPSISIESSAFSWQPGKPILRDINISIPAGSLTVVVGSVGSGKSTLCQALLGEIPFSEGRMCFDAGVSHIGYCNQTPFLSNGSIRDNVIGFSPFDPVRYVEVITVTALTVDLGLLPQGDNTNVGSDGITLSGGQKQRIALARALYVDTKLVILDDVFSGLDANTEDQISRRVFGRDGLLRKRNATTVLCTNSHKQLLSADHVVALDQGNIIEQGPLSELLLRPGYVSNLLSDFHPQADTMSTEPSDAGDVSPMTEAGLTGTNGTAATLLTPGGDSFRQTGDTVAYKHYFKSVGLPMAISSIVFAASWGTFTNFSTVWLKFWSDDAFRPNPTHSFAWYAGIYALLQVCALISLLLLAVAVFILFVKKAGATLHRNILKTLVHAPLSFFVATDTGVVTNLFSQDLNLVDTELPNAFLNTIHSVSQAAGQAAVMLTASPYLAISYPFLAALLYILQKFYLRTSRQLRLLDLEAKSPLYSHFIDTIKGIATLRAFAFIPEEIEKNIQLVDTSQRPAYLLVMIQQWLNFVLDIVVMIMAVLMTTLAVRLHSNAGFTGASMVSLMSFAENLSGIVIFYTRLETSLGAISRLKSFQEEVKPEDQDEEDVAPPKHWPSTGSIQICGLSATYDIPEPDAAIDQPKMVLDQINLQIEPGEKIAICGRTGSGKSSLISLLLKLLDPLSGTIIIDGLSLRDIDRSALRQSIFAMPQEAVFLPDGTTFHLNLDPSGMSTLEECQTVLALVGLLAFVKERGGLTAGMEAGTLSAGQRQLMSLCRVLLRRRIRAKSIGASSCNREGGVLILDEVSSNVDQDTERAMQDIIRTEFKRFTILAVSHRLNMVMDSDRVIVLDNGKVIEIGDPFVLAGQEDSRFGKLVKTSRG